MDICTPQIDGYIDRCMTKWSNLINVEYWQKFEWPNLKGKKKQNMRFNFFFVRKYVLLEHHKSMDKKSETQRESQEQ